MPKASTGPPEVRSNAAGCPGGRNVSSVGRLVAPRRRDAPRACASAIVNRLPGPSSFAKICACRRSKPCCRRPPPPSARWDADSSPAVRGGTRSHRHDRRARRGAGRGLRHRRARRSRGRLPRLPHGPHVPADRRVCRTRRRQRRRDLRPGRDRRRRRARRSPATGTGAPALGLGPGACRPRPARGRDRSAQVPLRGRRRRGPRGTSGTRARLSGAAGRHAAQSDHRDLLRGAGPRKSYDRFRRAAGAGSSSSRPSPRPPVGS